MEQHSIIDETFAGIARPTQTFEIGRPDIEDERPGSALIAAVREFEAADGFKKIAETRDAARVAEEKVDASVVRAKGAEVDFAIIPKDSHAQATKND